MLKLNIKNSIKIIVLILLFLMLWSTLITIKETFLLIKIVKIFAFISSFVIVFKLINIKKIKSSIFLIILLLVAFGLRLFWIYELDTQPYSDFDMYYKSALKIVEGDKSAIYDNVYYQYNSFNIGFTLFLSMIIFFFKSLFSIKIFNVIIGTLIVLYTYKTSKTISNEPIARITSLIVVFYPPFIVYTSILTNQSISILFTIISIYLFFKNKNLFLVGFILSIAQLMRPTAIIYLIGFVSFIILSGLLKKGDLTKKIKEVSIKSIKLTGSYYVLILITSLIFQTTKVSKYSLFYNPAPSYKYLVGLNHASIGKWNKEDGILKYSENFEEKAKILIKERTKDKIKLVKLFKNKFKLFWGKKDVAFYWARSENIKSNKYIYEHIMKIEHYFYLSLLVFSIISVLYYKDELSNYYLFYILIFGFVIIYLLIEIQVRYRYETYPLFIFLSGVGISKLNTALNKI